jgi:hypothetical protein
VSEFFGIIIYVYYNDHSPPHFHAEYAEHEALFRIETMELHSGSLPNRARALVLEWASLHRDELMENWELARQGLPLKEIPPLE